MLRAGSLFSGAGLCDLGFHRAGYGHRFFCEVDPYCRQVLARHWPGIPVYKDVRELCPEELPTVDVLVGGFPCQDVSACGRHAGINPHTRSGLWYEYKRIIKGLRPKYAVIENVKGLLSRGMEIVLQDLSDIGYAAEWQNLPAAAFGAPHLRERIFIVAYPDSDQYDSERRILLAPDGNMADILQFGSVSAWGGVWINRERRQAFRQAFGCAALYGVDDGGSRRMDRAGRTRPGVPLISP
ncbi:MAG: DNA cytosine methyltransferase, partial [Desulfovibrio sp.]|nr:DNA cytosine methyltransferase [Desulfovibrio sp.]